MRKINVLIAALSLFGASSVMAAGVAIGAGSQVAVCAAASGPKILGSTDALAAGAKFSEDADVQAASFVKVAFSIQCGATTHVAVTNAAGDATNFTVGSTSTKGNQTYKGSAKAGNVVLHGACAGAAAGTACVAADATDADTAAGT
jgi:hypothetical protein